MSSASSPTAALLTPRGRGAVATIRLHGDVSLLDSGDAPLFHAANGQPSANQPLQRIVFGRWGSTHDDQPPEEIVVCRTASAAVEIHCHGGDAASARILADLKQRGCAIVPAFDLVKQLNGTFDAECLDAVSRAVTLRTAAILIEQQSGTLRNAFENLRTELSHPPLTTPHSPLLTDLLRWANFGLHLTQPWRVVLAGRPNVGKSSLINALVGYQRSIVFDEPGTTRDVVTAETALDGWPIQFADTAGLRDVDADDLESAGIELARRQLDEADLRLLVLDLSQPRTSDDERLLAEWTDALVVANKSDLPNAWQAESPTEHLIVSARTGAGMDKLCEAIAAQLVPEVPSMGTPVPITARQFQLLAYVVQAMVNHDLALAIKLCDELLA
jgi:tRNA modification GTPase